MFCEDGDLLSQWRGYGASGGYAVGIHSNYLIHSKRLTEVTARYLEGRPESEPNSLRNVRLLWQGFRRRGESAMPDAWKPGVRLVQVEYGPQAIGRMIEKVLANVAPAPTGHPGVAGFYRTRDVAFPALAEIKHEAFAEEREWRLIAVGSAGEEEMSFRTGTLGVIPYLKLALPTHAVAEIVVGPGRDQALRERGVRRLVEESGLGPVEVRLSKAPFRG